MEHRLGQQWPLQDSARPRSLRHRERNNRWIAERVRIGVLRGLIQLFQTWRNVNVRILEFVIKSCATFYFFFSIVRFALIFNYIFFRLNDSNSSKILSNSNVCDYLNKIKQFFAIREKHGSLIILWGFESNGKTQFGSDFLPNEFPFIGIIRRRIILFADHK